MEYMTRRLLFQVLAAGAQEPPPIRVDVSLVNVPFSARDARGQLVKTLSKDDIEILEDGVPQTISHFSTGAGSSLSIGLIADMSGSQREFQKDHRRDLKDFLKNVMQKQDKAFLICFAGATKLVAPLTASIDAITDSFRAYERNEKGVVFPSIGPQELRAGASSVYDAIYNTSEEVMSRIDTGRRALILFSDGEDTSSAHNLMDAIEAAQRCGSTVFCLRYTELNKNRWTARNKYGRSVMERIARDTGGLDFDAGESDNLREAYKQIADILRASYDLGYSSSNKNPDATFRKIQIRAKRADLTFRHKAGYYAR